MRNLQKDKLELGKKAGADRDSKVKSKEVTQTKNSKLKLESKDNTLQATDEKEKKHSKSKNSKFRLDKNDTPTQAKVDVDKGESVKTKKSKLRIDRNETEDTVITPKNKEISKTKKSRLRLDNKDNQIQSIDVKAKDYTTIKQSRLKLDKTDSLDKGINKNFSKRKQYKSIRLYKSYSINKVEQTYSSDTNTTIKFTKNPKTQKLYEKHLSKSLRLTSSQKIEEAPKMQLSEKSQIAIRLYNEMNPEYSKTQLQKYNIDFNKRSYVYNYNRENFDTNFKRASYKKYAELTNYNKDFKRANYNNDFKQKSYTKDTKQNNSEKAFKRESYSNDSKRINFKKKFKRKNFKEKSKRSNFNLKSVIKNYRINKKNKKLKFENNNSNVDTKEEKEKLKKIRKKKQKANIKRRYAVAFREALEIIEKNSNKNSTTSDDLQSATKRVGKFIGKGFMAIVKSLMPLALLFLIKIVVVNAVILLLMAVVQGPVASFIGSSYTAEEEDLLTVESTYCEMEDGLREEIANIEDDYPDYDYYEYIIDDIGHDPYDLASYLTALLLAYTTQDAGPELLRLFELMYVLEFEEIEGEKFVPDLDSDGEQIYDSNDEPQGQNVPTLTLVVTLTTTSIEDIALFLMTEDEFEMFELLLETKGNSDDIFGGNSEDAIMSVMSVATSEKPTTVTTHHMITDSQFAKTLSIGEQFIGQPYVWGGSSPSTGFDCSGFISYILNESGVASFPRTTAQGLYNMSTPIPNGQQQAGDLVFFQGTYNTPNTVTHVGYYVGNGIMLHCGNPIGYVDINSSAYAKNFYAFGRIN